MSDPVYITLTLTRRQREMLCDALYVYKTISAASEEDVDEAHRLHETLQSPWPEGEKDPES